MISEKLLEQEINSIGIFGGDSGKIIMNLFLQTDDGRLEADLERCLEIITNKDVLMTYCSGLAGLCWLFNYLKVKNIIDIDLDKLFLDTDEYLNSWAKNQIQRGNFDFLHGAIGAGFYFLSRVENKNHRIYLSELVDGLNEIAIKEDDGSIKFLSMIDHESKTMGYNLSLSHGLASIIVFLARCFEKDINSDIACQLINGCVSYLLKQRFPNTNEYISVFPSSVSENQIKRPSRMAWCYGDLGIGIALYQAALITKNKEWEDLALNVLRRCAKRTDLKQNSVVDAGLCHGTAGIGQVFHRMYRYSNDPKFRTAAQYWFDQTKKKAIHKDGIEGYKTWNGEKGWVNETNLLEGVSGIKLALYCWENNIDPDWDSCLLLS